MRRGLTPPACCDTTTCTVLPDGAACKHDVCDEGSCQAGTCTSDPDPAGTPCNEDGDACTRDACDGAGACVAAGCSPCCDAGPGCGVPSIATCIRSLDRGTRVRLRTAPAGKERVQWAAQHLATTTAADLGTPTLAGDHELRVYQGSAPPRLVLDATLPAASICGRGPCWKQTTAGVGYRSPSRAPDGVAQLAVRSGGAGKGRLVVSGKGSELLSHTPVSEPPAPLASPVTIALHGDAACWATTFGDAATVVQKNAPGDYAARRGQ